MKNVYLQLACNILSKNQNPSYKGKPVYSGHFVNLPQVTIIDRFDCSSRNISFLQTKNATTKHFTVTAHIFIVLDH